MSSFFNLDSLPMHKPLRPMQALTLYAVHKPLHYTTIIIITSTLDQRTFKSTNGEKERDSERECGREREKEGESEGVDKGERGTEGDRT